jgi:hypothetical protein
MRILFACVSLSLFALGAHSTFQQPEEADSCRFTVSGSTTKPTITGPDDVIALVHVIEQPDSPVEILSMDFKDSFVSVDHERFSDRLRWTMKVRNRSDRPIKGVHVQVLVTSSGIGAGSGFEDGPGQFQDLAPNQEVEVHASGSTGSGDARGNHILILVFVTQVNMNECFYLPSKRVPFKLGGSIQ